MEKQNDESTDKADIDDSMKKLEDALVLCKFGKFNVKLMITSLLAVIAASATTTTSSYIISNVECDLKMTIMEKGLLNAVPFVGHVGAALFTGFLTDAFGRKIFLVGGHICMFLCALVQGSSQNYSTLVFGKLMDGIFVSICFSATATMVPEFTHKDVRDRVLLLYSSFHPFSFITMALMAWAILPHTWHFVIVEGYFELHTWNIYLYVCSVFSILAAICYYLLPESPKFLLAHGQEKKALEVLRRIYHENTGNPPETFPDTLLSEKGVSEKPPKPNFKKQIVKGLFEVKEMFRRPLLFRLLLFCTLTFVCLLVSTSLRLWYPQLSTIIENYGHDHEEPARFCVMINEYTKGFESNVSLIENATEVCVPKLSGALTYINSIFFGLVSMATMGVSVYLVAYTGQKPLMTVYFILCSICSGSLYWTYSSIQIAMLLSVTFACIQTAFSLQHSIIVRCFPTTLRGLAISFTMMTGRIGSLSGNILFPVLLEAGCMGPFITLSTVTLCVAALVYFLANPKKENKAGDK